MRNIAIAIAVDIAVAGLLGTLAVGCAAQQPVIRPAPPPPPPVAAPAPPPAPRVIKLVVMPVEKLPLPEVAAALNEKLGKASVPGVTATTTTTFSMDVALMQLDCNQPSNECYRQIARRLEADRLLWAEIDRAKRGKKKRLAPTTIRIVLFDAERAVVVGRAEQTFPAAVTNDELDQLLARATAQTGDQPALAQP